MIRSLLLSVFMVLGFVTQVMSASPMEEYFYSSGKIRVVIAVAAVVMVGLLSFVILLDRRVKRLEKKNQHT